MIPLRVATLGVLATLSLTSIARATPASPPIITRTPPATTARVAPVITPPSPGDKRRIIGILDVRVDGVAPEVATTFQTGLEQQLDTGHFWLATRVRVKQMMERSTKWTDGCVVGGCLREVKTQTGAELVVTAALTGSGTSYGYVVTLLRTDTGEVVSQESDRCDVCTATEAVDAATIATIKLVTAVPDRLPDPGALDAALAADHATIEHDRAVHTHHRRHVGTALAIVGVVAAAAGAVIYVATDHDRPGMAGLGGGVGLALGGLAVLTF